MFDNLKFINKLIRHLALLAALFVFGGCATSVSIKAEIPQPLIEQLPLSGKMVLSDDFKSYVYQEKEKARSLKRLSFGDAQTEMFNIIFSRLLELSPNNEQPVDVLIEPELLDFQYTAPRETKLKLYEVFLKYRLKLTGRNDQKLADWTIKGYGKTPTSTLTSASTAFNAAANVALRDVGAQLATRFGRQSSIVALLPSDDGEPVSSASEPVTTGEAQADSAQSIGGDYEAEEQLLETDDEPAAGEENE